MNWSWSVGEHAADVPVGISAGVAADSAEVGLGAALVAGAAAEGEGVGVFWPKIFAVSVSVAVGVATVSVGVGRTVGGLTVGLAAGTQAMSATTNRNGNNLWNFTDPLAG